MLQIDRKPSFIEQSYIYLQMTDVDIKLIFAVSHTFVSF